jgi:hypothetical protein
MRAAVAAAVVFAMLCGASTYAYLDARVSSDPSRVTSPTTPRQRPVVP